MKIQSLAVIFVIIIMPISLVLSHYMQTQIQTLNLQTSYDSRLDNATYDAVKTFQLNTVNSGSSDITNSKIRDIEASVNSFFNSVASNFNLGKASVETIREYVPALVYTMYDGFYIYTPFDNNLSQLGTQPAENSTYEDDDKVYGLKPYIYYSREYKMGNDQFVITYSLDNYISVQGYIDNKYVNDSGYVITGRNIGENGSTYRSANIKESEDIKEKVAYIEKEEYKAGEYSYVKVNGVKNYKDGDKYFTVLNGNKHDVPDDNTPRAVLGFDADNNQSARNYYKEAKEFYENVISKIKSLKSSDAVDYDPNDKAPVYNIFNDDTTSLEDPNSDFNGERLEVIRTSIEDNLSTAIANYNDHFSKSAKADFQMPNLKEDEWDKLLNNISVISFLQGIPIGGKVYNGYSIVTNNKNEEVVSEDSIYITTGSEESGKFHRINHEGLNEEITNNSQGIFNIDFERKALTAGSETNYYLPHNEKGCYECIVNGQAPIDNIYKYLSDNPELASIYYTALGRERYGMYKTQNELVY